DGGEGCSFPNPNRSSLSCRLRLGCSGLRRRGPCSALARRLGLALHWPRGRLRRGLGFRVLPFLFQPQRAQSHGLRPRRLERPFFLAQRVLLAPFHVGKLLLRRGFLVGHPRLSSSTK